MPEVSTRDNFRKLLYLLKKLPEQIHLCRSKVRVVVDSAGGTQTTVNCPTGDHPSRCPTQAWLAGLLMVPACC